MKRIRNQDNVNRVEPLFGELVWGEKRWRGREASPLIGLLPGEGIGPELTDYAATVLEVLGTRYGFQAEIERGGDIGVISERASGAALTEEVVGFCESISDRGGAILAGPGGGRFVYDLRRRFDLYVKFSPLLARPELHDASPLKSHRLGNADIVVVRDNIAGVYQGVSSSDMTGNHRRVRHEFGYDEAQIEKLITVGVRLAAKRSGRATLVIKCSGIPVVSDLWIEVGQRVGEAMDVEVNWIDVDYSVYRLMDQPDQFDVIITPNLIGDVIGDLGAVLVGSRGLTFSGNYSEQGMAVYQTNHGSAYDLVGQDRANPGGHLLALAMMLRHSFGLIDAADGLENAMRRCWYQGWRTADLCTNGHTPIGSAAFVERVIDQLTIPSESAEHT